MFLLHYVLKTYIYELKMQTNSLSQDEIAKTLHDNYHNSARVLRSQSNAVTPELESKLYTH
jgi:hypothetical protein